MAQGENNKSSIFHGVEDLIKGDYRTFAEVLLYYSSNYRNEKLVEVKSTLLEAAEKGEWFVNLPPEKYDPHIVGWLKSQGLGLHKYPSHGKVYLKVSW